MALEQLFGKIDDTEHVYTWDYTVQESARALYDVNDEFFALITDRREIDDETGAMGDYRDNSGYCGYLFLKSDPKPVQAIPHGTRNNPEVLHYGEESPLIDAIKSKTDTTDIRRVEEITLDLGRVYISEGNLLLDRNQA